MSRTIFDVAEAGRSTSCAALLLLSAAVIYEVLKHVTKHGCEPAWPEGIRSAAPITAGFSRRACAAEQAV
jgi:hypothetical protein